MVMTSCRRTTRFLLEESRARELRKLLDKGFVLYLRMMCIMMLWIMDYVDIQFQQTKPCTHRRWRPFLYVSPPFLAAAGSTQPFALGR
eukprot:4574030-Amphidinium_carterae.1